MAKRIKAIDWLQQGLHQLSEHGVASLTIDQLCTALGKSKGSFYHHFKDMSGYIGALLNHWCEIQTTDVIGQVETRPDPEERELLLAQIVAGLDHRLELIIRSWARSDSRAATAVQQVDGLRVQFLCELYSARGLDHEQALAMAELEYTTFLGAQQRFVDLKTAEAQAVYQNLVLTIQAFIRSIKS